MRFHFIILSMQNRLSKWCIMTGLNLRRLNRTEMCVIDLQGLQRNVEKTTPKIHLILHLPDSMLRFGPASSFNTER